MPRALALVILPLLALGTPYSPVTTHGGSWRTPADGAGTRSAAWRWPVDAPHTVVRPFLGPATPYSAGHRGIDIAAPGGTVFAPADGVVSFAGVVVDRPVLSIRHENGVVTSYEPVASILVAGADVAAGDPVGSVVVGHCGSPCLHFGVRVHGEYASPLAWLGGIERAVLLPTRAPPRP
jgi:murein DD-endopeptidase MepM/ murein hydrolase activator NlpD